MSDCGELCGMLFIWKDTYPRGGLGRKPDVQQRDSMLQSVLRVCYDFESTRRTDIQVDDTFNKAIS